MRLPQGQHGQWGAASAALRPPTPSQGHGRGQRRFTRPPQGQPGQGECRARQPRPRGLPPRPKAKGVKGANSAFPRPLEAGVAKRSVESNDRSPVTSHPNSRVWEGPTPLSLDPLWPMWLRVAPSATTTAPRPPTASNGMGRADGTFSKPPEAGMAKGRAERSPRPHTLPRVWEGPTTPSQGPPKADMAGGSAESGQRVWEGPTWARGVPSATSTAPRPPTPSQLRGRANKVLPTPPQGHRGQGEYRARQPWPHDLPPRPKGVGGVGGAFPGSPRADVAEGSFECGGLGPTTSHPVSRAWEGPKVPPLDPPGPTRPKGATSTVATAPRPPNLPQGCGRGRRCLHQIPQGQRGPAGGTK